MSQILTAKQVCERALRAIGAFPITESAADGEQLREAMSWLDLILAQEAGTNELFNLIPATLTVPITNGTQVYPLAQTLSATLPVDDIQFPVRAWLQDSEGHREPIEIVAHQKFMTVEDPAETGPPRMIYIDHLAKTPTLSIFPVPDLTDPNTWSILLDVQTYAPNVAPSGVTGAQPSGSVVHNFRQAWQRWMVAQLSHDLGSGPIFKLPEASLNRFGKIAVDARTQLLAFENRSHDTEPPICEPHGM
jgi:hypothetical protein